MLNSLVKLREHFHSSRTALYSLSSLLVTTLLSAVFAFVTQILLARSLGPSAYGGFATALATILLLSPLAGFGLGAYWLRIFGLEGWAARRWLKPSLILVSLTTLLTFSAALAWALWGTMPAEVRLLTLILAPLLLLSPLTALLQARFQLEERYKQLAFWQMIPNASRFLIALVGAFVGLSAVNIAVGFSITSLLLSTIFAVYIGRMVAGHFKLVGHQESTEQPLSIPSLKEVAAGSWPFALAGIFYFVYFQSDIILLGWLRGSEAAGVYNVAFSVMAAVYLLPTVIFQKFLLPKYHRWAEHDRLRFLQAYRLGNSSMLITGGAVMVGLMLVSPWLVPLVFGKDYLEAGRILLILSLCVPLRYVATSVGGTLLTQNHMRRKVWLQGLAAIVNLGLNLLLIPSFASYGAAIATVVAEATILVTYLVTVKKHVFHLEGWTLWQTT